MADEQTTTTNDNPVQETVLGSQGSDNQSTDWRSSLSEELKAILKQTYSNSILV